MSARPAMPHWPGCEPAAGPTTGAHRRRGRARSTRWTPWPIRPSAPPYPAPRSTRLPYLAPLRELIRRILGPRAFSYPAKVLRAVYPERPEARPRGRYIHYDYGVSGVQDMLTSWVPLMAIPVRLGGLAVQPGGHLGPPRRPRPLSVTEPGLGDHQLRARRRDHLPLPDAARGPAQPGVHPADLRRLPLAAARPAGTCRARPGTSRPAAGDVQPAVPPRALVGTGARRARATSQGAADRRAAGMLSADRRPPRLAALAAAGGGPLTRLRHRLVTGFPPRMVL